MFKIDEEMINMVEMEIKIRLNINDRDIDRFEKLVENIKSISKMVDIDELKKMEKEFFASNFGNENKGV